MGDWKIIVSGSQKDFATDYGFRVSQAPGTGFAPVENIWVDYGLLDGGLFQRTRVGVKSFSLVGTVSGSSVAGLLGNRRALIDAVKPDRTTPQEPVVIQYAGGASTVQASAYYDGGLELGNIESFHEPRVALQFVQFDPYWEVAASDGMVTAASAQLTVQASMTNASYLVRRDKHGYWYDMGAGLNGSVNVLHRAGSLMWVGGSYDQVGGSTACNVSYWNISSCTWAHVDNGVNGQVNDIVSDAGGTVYIGGEFTKMGSGASSACRVCRVSGGSLLNAGSGMNGDVDDLAIHYATNWLYAVGTFLTADGTAASRLAYYDPIGASWSADLVIPVGLAPLAVDIPKTACRLYIGGFFSTFGVGASAACSVFQYDGNSFTYLGSGSGAGFGQPTGGGIAVYDIHTSDAGRTYFAGGLSSYKARAEATPAATYYVGEWSGTTFYQLGDGFIDTGVTPVYDVTTDNYENVHVSGAGFAFSTACNYNSLAYFNGADWLPVCFKVSPTTNDTILAVAFDADDTMYVSVNDAGSAMTEAVTSVTVTGTTVVYPTFSASGPGRLYQLLNTTTDKKVFFDIILGTGEVVTLDFVDKTFVSNTRGNIISKIVPSSDLVSFGLVPGANLISLFIDDGTASAAMFWKNRNWSIDI